MFQHVEHMLKVAGGKIIYAKNVLEPSTSRGYDMDWT